MISHCDLSLPHVDCTANDQCKNACGLTAALATKCPNVTAGDVRIIGDAKLLAAIKAHIADFATVANEIFVVHSAFEHIADRTPGDFQAIGLVHDVAYRCVDQGVDTSKQVRTSLDLALAATNVINGTQF